MPNTVEQYAGELRQLAARYHRFQEDPGLFLQAIRDTPAAQLREYLDWAEPYITKRIDGVLQISPVVFLRRVLVTRILAGVPVTLADLTETAARIDARDAEFFAGEHPAYLDAILAQKQRQRSAFHSWQPFTLLFYVDYWRHRVWVKERLQAIAVFLRQELRLEGQSDFFLAGFDFNQAFGTDRCWLALYPPEHKTHRTALQLFFNVLHDGFEYGLVPGSDVPLMDAVAVEARERTPRLDAAGMVSRLRERLPAWTRGNHRLLGDETGQSPTPARHPLNLVLYGPPGTGKTYSVQRRAVEIVEGAPASRTGREVAERFRRYVEEGRIEFVTFHPSYSYEEFVEGFRFDPDRGFPVLQDGILLQLVDRAVNPHALHSAAAGARIWKVSLGSRREQHVFKRCMDAGEIAIGWFDDVDLTGMDEGAIRGVFERNGKGSETNNIGSVNSLVNEIQEGDYVAVLKDVRTIRAIGVVTGEYRYREHHASYRHTRPVEWVDRREHDIVGMNGGKGLTATTIYPLERVPLQSFVDLVPRLPGDPQPYVLVIDEINRGNLSRIFGELMTLLEPDKRRGAENEVAVRLPYSRKPFTLPSNLHVIGTMNTADRSIALLDVALRRRFEFEEVMPDAEVIRNVLGGAIEDGGAELTPEQVELICTVFEALNRRITVLLDRDHQIGHSYFLGARSMPDLHDTLYLRVFPLLHEYFYNDPERLTRVLGRREASLGRGFVAPLDQYAAALPEGEVDAAELPWEFHRYGVGELEEVLRRTFLP
jgi:5-methylcytosine-specific restriction protein B